MGQLGGVLRGDRSRPLCPVRGERLGSGPAGGGQEELARQAIARTVDYFRSLGMPTCLTELGCGLQSEEELKELARRCTFYGARTIGAFRVLGEADILAIYRAANR